MPQLNLSQVTESGAASYSAASDVFTLTPDATNQTGAVMSNDRIDLTQDFSISFSAFLGSNDAGGDGIAFVLHNAPSGADAIGGAGGSMGARGIANGLAISLDTYSNAGEPSADHTAFFDTDAADGTTLTQATSLSNLEDSQWHDVTVSWTAGTQTLSYWIDGQHAGTLSGDLAGQYFGGSDYVHFGFTGGTGASKNLQQVKVTGVAATYVPPPPTPPEPEIPPSILPNVTESGAASYAAASDVFTLTPDATNQTGAVMSNDRIDLTQDFSITFSAFLGGNDAGGDGIAFVLHNAPSGADAIGGAGGSMGARGIANGLAISLDTYSNAGEPSADHTAFFDTDAADGTTLTQATSLSNLEDSQWHDVTVSWTAGTQTLSYWIDGQHAGILSGDLAGQYFGGSDHVHFGFTGGTGASKNLQQVKVTGVAATYVPPPPTPPEPEIPPSILPNVTESGAASYSAASDVFTLTPDATNQTGAVMSNDRIDLTQDFSITFSAFLGSNDAGGDGIAFVLHNAPSGADAIGGAGGSMGARGIANGLAISLDTYSNAGEPSADHTAFFDTDAADGTTLTQATSLSNLEDSQWHDVTVSWTAGTQTLSYWIDGQHAGILSGDLAGQYFGGSDHVHFGFTGGTGASKNLQQVKVTGVAATYVPAEAPTQIENDGQWSDVFDWPIIGIQATLTPDGKVLTYGTDQFGQQGAALIYDVWDPVTNTHYTLPNKTPTDMFCAAAIVVPSTGYVLISGGDARPIGHVNMGVHDVNVFDYRDMSISVSQDGPMTYQRWYPTVVGLANGKILILGGKDMSGAGVGTPELYTPGEGWKSLTGAYSATIAQDWWYPRAWLAPNGNVVLLDSNSTAQDRSDVMIMDPSGNGTLTKVADLPFTTGQQLPAVKYAPDKVLILDNQGGAWIMDIGGDVPTFQKTGSLGEVRQWGSLVVLADGSVMVSGGSDVENQLIGVHNEVQIWNPHTGVWTTDDAAAVARMYHSTTILLPDATVLSLGGGAPGPLTNLNGEIYKPGYLFSADGSLAIRPVITDAPQSIEQRQDTFTVTMDDAASITRLTFIKTGSATHSLDMSSSMLDLSFTHGPDNTLVVTAPSNANVLAPGNWMLFAFNDQGTPSVAATIFVDLGGELFSSTFGGYVTQSGAASYAAASDIFTLTPDAAGKNGAVMSNDRIDLTHDFAITFDAFLGSDDAGADGIAFVLHNDPSGADAIGGGGGSRGAQGIAKGLAISLDTYSNPGEPASDFTALFDTDAAAGATLTNPTLLSNLENSQWHNVTVSWIAATQTLTYWVDGQQGGTISGDLAAQYFGGSDYVHFGFTGATGGGKNLQQVKVTSLTATHVPNSAFAQGDPHAQIDMPQIGGTARMSGSAAFDSDRHLFTLTPEGASKTGAVMSDATIDLHSDFDISFNFLLGSTDGGSNGATFVLQSDPHGSNATGSGGAGLGASGIANGLAIAFNAELGAETTSLVDTDAGSSLQALTSSVSLGNLENGHWHQANVVWDADTQTLKYWVDGSLAGTLSGNLVAQYFGGSHQVHFGFTGATGAGGNLEQVRVTQLDANDGELHYGDLAACDCKPFIDTDEHSHINSVGSASIDATNLITLTSGAPSTAGSALSMAWIDLHTDFSVTFNFNAGDHDVAGGGLAFVLHNDPLGGDALGGTGAALGAEGIGKGLGIAFSMQEGADQTNFFDTDLGTSAGAVSAQTTISNLEDGNWHSSQVTWDASIQTLSYWIDGQLGGTLSGDLAQLYFGGSDLVNFGFTGSTGETGNVQLVQVTGLNADLLCAECEIDEAGHSHDDTDHDHTDGPGAHDGLTIAGGSGDDNLIGGSAGDTFIGGLGSDTLTGGAGSDHFAYRLAAEGGDTIKDFLAIEDSLSFSASGFGAGLVAGQNLLADINFVAEANPTPTTDAGTFLFNTESNDLAWDFDGLGAGDPVQIAHFDMPVSLTINHFEITA